MHREPQGIIGSHRKSLVAIGNYREPKGIKGNHWELQGAIENQREPQGIVGRHRGLQGALGSLGSLREAQGITRSHRELIEQISWEWLIQCQWVARLVSIDCILARSLSKRHNFKKLFSSTLIMFWGDLKLLLAFPNTIVLLPMIRFS